MITSLLSHSSDDITLLIGEELRAKLNRGVWRRMENNEENKSEQC